MIKGARCVLRAVEKSDLDLLLEMVNDPEIQRLSGGWSLPVSKTEQENWLHKLADDGSRIRLVIEAESDGPIGVAAIDHIEARERKCSVGLKLRSGARQTRNLAVDVVNTLVAFAFDELNMHRLEARIVTYNESSLRLFLDRLGWTSEGVLRDATYRRGRYHNVLLCSLLEEEYRARSRDSRSTNGSALA